MPLRSAGILLYRRPPSGVEVLLGHPGGPYYVKKDDGVWSIPKGELEPDEEPLAAAIREFSEEMGTPPPAGTPWSLGSAKQSGGKVNVIYALEGDFDVAGLRSNTFPMQWPPRSGRTQLFEEIDRAGWFDLGAARVKLRTGQHAFLDRLAAALAEQDAAG
jgi:predicted NUDIX family NTP pyrophosphohydrolase